MTEPKKNANPFVKMANDAKMKNSELHPGLGRAPRKQGPKVNSKGFGGSSVTRRSARGG